MDGQKDWLEQLYLYLPQKWLNISKPGHFILSTAVIGVFSL